MPSTIQLRRDTAANWTSYNPTLHSGEFGIETDTKKVKLGDGTTAWTSLAYWAGGGVVSVAAGDASIVVGGTATNPTLETGTLDVLATLHPPAAALPMNSKKITGLANGSAATDAAAFGQIPTSASQIGGVTSVTAADTSIVVGGTSTAPTVGTGTLDVIATNHPPAAAWSNNSKKITSLANGTAASDAAAFGQIPTALPPNGSAGGVLSGTYPNPGFATTPLPESGGTMTGWLAPAVVALTDAATILVNAALGNDFRVTLGGNRTMGAPSNPVDGQDITFLITQPASGGPYTVTWTSSSGGYSFGAGSAPTLSTAANKSDLIAFKYVAAKTAWLYMGSSLGY